RKAPKGEYIETDTGNKVSRKACISGTANITLGGKTVIQSDVHLRGDLHRWKEPGKAATAIIIGKYTVIGAGCVIKPPCRMNGGQLSYFPLRIGEHVFIGPDSVISAANIGSHVYIGEHCVLEPFSILRDNVKVLPHTVIPANMVIPSNSVVGGRPGRVVGELGEGWGESAGAGMGGGGGAEWVEGGDLRELVRSI
ncbi:trimeric LpxA-like protein, partial [Saccharata proteae CBS 121410]